MVRAIGARAVTTKPTAVATLDHIAAKPPTLATQVVTPAAASTTVVVIAATLEATATIVPKTEPIPPITKA